MIARGHELRAATSPTTSSRSASVYTLVIIAYVLTSLAFSVGLRIPYSRWSDAC